MTTKIDKIKAMATHPTTGKPEREAAIEALRRLGVPLAIEMVANEITLTDTPPEYAPSRLHLGMIDVFLGRLFCFLLP